MRTAALFTSSCAALTLSPAHAQDRPAEDKPTASDVAAASALDEIVVTARRRQEPAQRVPVSVLTLSEKELESRSVTNLRTLQNFVPNLTFAPSQNVGEAAGNMFIRGIGQEDFGVGAEPGVGFYVDGVYFSRTLGTIMNVTDIARIEVLRGPQGTLFGKNTIGGVINLISVLPQGESERRARIILGNDDRLELRAVVNQPLSDQLLVRLSGAMVSRDGYVRRLRPSASISTLESVNRAPVDLGREGDDHDLAGRLQLRWLVSETLTADISLDGSRRHNRQGATHLDAINPKVGTILLLNGLIAQGKLPGPKITADLVSPNLLESHATGRNRANQRLWGSSATIAGDIGGATLKFIGAYRELRSRVGTDTDGFHFDVAETDLRINHRQLTGELQLAGTRGSFTYTGGLFVLRERSQVLPTASSLNRILYTCGCLFHPSQLTAEPRQLSTTSIAAYAQGTYRLAEKLSATIGARYSRETKRIAGKVLRLDADLQPTSVVVAVGTNRGTWSPLTWRAGFEYQASRDVLAYASLAKGYKSGGFNARAAPDLPNMGFYSFRPESALTYELGLRSEWLNRRLRFNATVFHTDYRDIQLRQQTLINGRIETLIDNAARARIRGAEVEVTAAPRDGLTLSAGYGHLAPKYLDVGNVVGLTPDNRFQRTPRHSFTGSVHYERPVGPGTLELHADYSFRSKEQFQIAPAINDQVGYGLLGARATFRAANDRWTIAVFGTNLADRRYRTAGRGTLINQSGLAYSSVGLPRQLGVQFMSKF